MSSNHEKAKGDIGGEKTKLNTGELYVCDTAYLGAIWQIHCNEDTNI